mgnify:CR=1 FL=1
MVPPEVNLRPLAERSVAYADNGSVLATFHAPDDLLVAVCPAPDRRHHWEWIKWLPHARHPSKIDALGPRRLVAATAKELEELLEDLVASRPRYGGPTSNPDGLRL